MTMAKAQYTEMQQAQIRTRLEYAEQALFDSELALEVEQEALAHLPAEQSQPRLEGLVNQAQEARGRVKALRARSGE